MQHIRQIFFDQAIQRPDLIGIFVVVVAVVIVVVVVDVNGYCYYYCCCRGNLEMRFLPIRAVRYIIITIMIIIKQ